MRILTRYALGISAAALLAGCGGPRQVQNDTQLPMRASEADAAKPLRSIEQHANSCPCLYVANLGRSSVTVYASRASGNSKPIQDINGSKTGLSHPHDLAVDGSGNVYAVNVAPTSVTVYAAGATGNAKPIETISGSTTGLAVPTGIAIDSVNGDIYVSNISGGRSRRGSITIYAPGSNGDVAPLGVIEGSKTRLDYPHCLALDASGNIDVTNGNNSVTVYPAGSTGNVAPARTIAGLLTQMRDPTEVAVDSGSNTYAANFNANSLTVYAAGANGNVAPNRRIHGVRTKLHGPFGVALDTDGNIYAASGRGVDSSISVYAAGSNGHVKPIKTLEGNDTGLDFPSGIAIR
jgi:hypothetical protein